MFGFGHDHLRDTYKTVAVYCDLAAKNIENKTMVKVYALGEDTSWRKMQSFPFAPLHSFICDHPGIFVSGTLSWLATRSDGSLVIVSVDIGKETCEEVLLPRVVVDQYEPVASPKLSVLKGSLCFSYDFSGIQFVVWQMKLYGATESWTMLFNISYLEYIDRDGIYNFFCFHHRPFFISDNGELLLKVQNCGSYILCNPRHNSCKYLQFRSKKVLLEGITHIDSLVSPCPTQPILS